MVAVAAEVACVGEPIVKLVESMIVLISYGPWMVIPPALVGAINCWNKPAVAGKALLERVTVTVAEPDEVVKIGNLPLEVTSAVETEGSRMVYTDDDKTELIGYGPLRRYLPIEIGVLKYTVL